MSDNFLSLDWRNAPPSKEIIHRLERVFTDVDDKTKSGTTLRLSQSTAKNAFSVVERNGHPIVMRHDNPVRLLHLLDGRRAGLFCYSEADLSIEPQGIQKSSQILEGGLHNSGVAG